jgi:hypothetical protein
MKTIITFCLLLIIISCSRKENEQIDHFILLGQSGFILKDTAQWKFDSSQFDIRQYFEFKINDYVRVAKRLYSDSVRYYTVSTADTLGLAQTISYSIFNRNYDSSYDINGSSMYDGYYYILYYHTTKGRSKFIKFVPEVMPDTLKVAFSYIDRIFRKDLKVGPKFNWPDILKDEALEFYKKQPPVPAPSKLELKTKNNAIKKDKN